MSPKTRWTWSQWSTLAAICIPVVIVNLDTTVLNVALPTLLRDLHTTHLQWIVDSYLLVFGGLLLAMGSLADRVGRKWTFMAGLLAFACASLWAAFSGSAGMLIVARGSMGVGAALIVPSTLAIAASAYPSPGEQSRAIIFWSVAALGGFALGPLVGGVLLQHFWWGSIFLVNVPIAVLGLLAAVRLVPNSKNPDPGRPDLPGTALSITGLGFILWGIIEAPSRGWSSAAVLGALVLGLVLVGAFAVWEKISSHPMLPLGSFRSRSFSVAVVCTALYAFALFGTLFLLTPALQFYLNYSPLQTGIHLLPTAVAFAVFAFVSRILVPKIGVRFTTLAGFAGVAVGLWQMSHAPASWSYREVLPWMILAGAGVGLLFPTLLRSVVSSMPPKDSGVASATNSTFLQFGAAIGVASLGSIMTSRYQGHASRALAPYRLNTHVEQPLLASFGNALYVLGHPRGQYLLFLHIVRSAFIDGTELAFTVAAFAALVGCVIALALPKNVEERQSPDHEATVPTTAPAQQVRVPSRPQRVVSRSNTAGGV